MNVRNSAAPLGAEITGLDLAQPLDETTFRAIEDVFHDRGVVVFRDQQLSEEEHIAFSRRFGELEIHVAKQYLMPGHPEILVLSNLVENGRNVGVADGGQFWHSDLSYVANPSRCSLLYAIEVPTRDGRVLGETLFASAEYAYDTLPHRLKTRLEGMRAVHRYADRYRKQQDACGENRSPRNNSRRFRMSLIP
jgi:taurine dioxygenase